MVESAYVLSVSGEKISVLIPKYVIVNSFIILLMIFYL